MQKRLSLVALAVFGVAASTPSFAADSVPFRYQASQLTTDAGAAAVYQRMTKAAADACSTNDIAARMRGEIAACKSRLLSDWVAASGSERLADIHRQSVL